ncbi:MAG: endonuclease/exonuclease/phosphatase family protein [Candidatus Hydrogenedentes bacterium]|nr:endonuclease/exonuclease/phosphatase family protein [Candidatus Hydrogenedentota bacterium]
MRIRMGIVALLTAFLGAAAPADTALTVMSFNVRYGTADDGPNSWDRRKDVLTRTIRQCAPDVLGTQECLDFQAKYIAAALPEYAWFGVGRERDGSGENVAIFYKKDTLVPEEKGQFWLSKAPETPGSKDWGSHSIRMVMWAKFQPKTGGSPFFYYNTHLDNGSEEARREGARLLADRIRHLPDGATAVVTGDFNDNAESSEPWHILTGEGMKDCWLAAANRIGPDVTWSAFQPPAKVSKSRIDWVLVRGSVKVESCETILYNEDGRYPSDHYPVCAKLILKN